MLCFRVIAGSCCPFEGLESVLYRAAAAVTNLVQPVIFTNVPDPSSMPLLSTCETSRGRSFSGIPKLLSCHIAPHKTLVTWQVAQSLLGWTLLLNAFIIPCQILHSRRGHLVRWRLQFVCVELCHDCVVFEWAESSISSQRWVSLPVSRSM
jgi:hypothetical protein